MSIGPRKNWFIVLRLGVLSGVLVASAAGLAHAADAPPADGPSFDCRKATTKLEHAICADPALAAADRQMAASYAQALTAAPPDWRAALRDSQRAWLSAMTKACQAGDLPQLASGATIGSCRRDAYAGRRKELSATLVNYGGTGFIQITTHTARIAAADDGSPDKISVQTVATLVQIARPDAAGAAWNRMIATQLARIMAPGTATAATGTVTVESVLQGKSGGQGFIQASINRTDARGPGGDSFSITPIAWSLRLGRPLMAADLFTHPQVAMPAVARLAMRQMQDSARASQADFDLKLSDVQALVAPTRYWDMDKDGLSFSFDDDTPFSAAHYAETVLSVTIPWADLAPYLRPDLPFDPKALQAE